MKVIEERINRIFTEIREDVPNLRRLTFEISSEHSIGKVSGWYHIGNGCERYDSSDELISAMDEMRGKKRENELLFRKF